MEIYIFLIAMITVCAYLYYSVWNKMSHFVRLKIPHAKPVPFLSNVAPFFFQRMTYPENIHQLYHLFPDAKYFGFYDFMFPIYMINDLQLINAIAIKNFDHFCDHNILLNKDVVPFAGKNLFDLRGDEWREMRRILTPCFTSGKMKIMFELIYKCADDLISFVISQSEISGKIHNMKDIINRLNIDVTVPYLFGINVNSFKDPNNKFVYLVRDIMNIDNKFFKIHFNRRFPALSNFLKLKTFDNRLQNFLTKMISDLIKVRKEQGITRPDIIQVMMETSHAKNKRILDIDEMAAQAFVFLGGGSGTVTSLMTFLSYEIGVNPDVQNKLKAEIDDVIARHGKLSYDIMKDMKYLDAVIKECLRLYPLVDFIGRRCVKEFQLPPATPDGKPVMLKPGDIVCFPNFSIHRDAKYFPEPEQFDPERFLNNRVDKAAYFPFGLGPRMCIGYKIALIQMKIVFFCLLCRCDIELAAETKIPLVLDKKSFLMSADGGIWSKLRPRKSTAAFQD